MIKHDKEILWRPRYKFYSAMSFTGMTVQAINEGGAGNYAYGESWVSAHTGANISAEIGSVGHNALLMDTAGDMVTHYAPIPADLDPKHPVYVRVHWSSGSTETADTIDWIVTYTQVIPNVTAIIDPVTALSTAIAQDTVPVATANAWCATEWGKINGGVLTYNTEIILWKVEMDAFAAGLSEAKHLLGLELRYTPRMLQGPDGMLHPAKPSVYKLAKQVA